MIDKYYYCKLFLKFKVKKDVLRIFTSASLKVNTLSIKIIV